MSSEAHLFDVPKQFTATDEAGILEQNATLDISGSFHALDENANQPAEMSPEEIIDSLISRESRDSLNLQIDRNQEKLKNDSMINEEMTQAAEISIEARHKDQIVEGKSFETPPSNFADLHGTTHIADKNPIKGQVESKRMSMAVRGVVVKESKLGVSRETKTQKGSLGSVERKKSFGDLKVSEEVREKSGSSDFLKLDFGSQSFLKTVNRALGGDMKLTGTESADISRLSLDLLATSNASSAERDDLQIRSAQSNDSAIPSDGSSPADSVSRRMVTFSLNSASVNLLTLNCRVRRFRQAQDRCNNFHRPKTWKITFSGSL